MKDEFSDKYGPDRNRNKNDSRDESEDLDKSDSDKDNTPSWEEIMRLLEKMNGSSAQKNDENKPGIKTEKKPYIGVMVSSLSDEVKAITGLQAGVLVQQVKRNTPASKAGIQAYDIILKVNETDITSCEELSSIIAESAPGDIFRIHLYRQGSILEFDVSYHPFHLFSLLFCLLSSSVTGAFSAQMCGRCPFFIVGSSFPFYKSKNCL